MLTLRIHLDPMCDANGPLVVVPGSHHDLSKTCDQASVPIHCGGGDVFVMRPLLLHGSRPLPETKLHRRVVHLEVAPSETLPSPYRWNKFASVKTCRPTTSMEVPDQRRFGAYLADLSRAIKSEISSSVNSSWMPEGITETPLGSSRSMSSLEMTANRSAFNCSSIDSPLRRRIKPL